MTPLDPRLAAFRPDLADARLKGKVEAARYVEGRPARVAVPVADLRSAPRQDAGVDTQLLFGDEVRVFDEQEGWAWVQAEADGYVGYLAAAVLGRRAPEPTHVVVAPRSFVYPGPDLKLPAAGAHSMGARVRADGEVEVRGTRYALLTGGEAMVANHLRPLGFRETDYVAVAERLIHAPYLWGGTTGFGVDCSGLVQLAMRMTGRTVLRDTDMQAATIGVPLEAGQELRRGDLVFWRGHVAILTDADTVIHANGATMAVSLEPLESAIARIEPLFGLPTGYRRP
jgi:cell wall-associated NlpC family hydrolase